MQIFCVQYSLKNKGFKEQGFQSDAIDEPKDPFSEQFLKDPFFSGMKCGEEHLII